MIFHLGFELPAPPVLDADSEALTHREMEIIRIQIRKNAKVIDAYVERLDLYLNREKVPKSEGFVKRLRGRMFLLMEENDTFRRSFWREMKRETDRIRLSR